MARKHLVRGYATYLEMVEAMEYFSRAEFDRFYVPLFRVSAG